jgi:hypothetical protein
MAFTFTLNQLIYNHIPPSGEEVKAKIQKHWTRARAREARFLQTWKEYTLCWNRVTNSIPTNTEIPFEQSQLINCVISGVNDTITK